MDRSLGRNKVASALRNAGATVVVHDDVFASNAPDTEWLERAGREKWVVLTKDRYIRFRANEKAALLAAGVRAFILASGNMTADAMAELFVSCLPKMRQFCATHAPPFIASVSLPDRVRLLEA